MLAPNTLLQNRYLIVRLLGQGGMGAVYQATDQRLGNTIALKQTFFTDEMMLKAFEREARLLASLRHSALPKVSDHFTESNGQFLVMEYIAGNDLMTMLEKRGGPFEIDQVIEWGDQLLGALSYLHTQHPPIIHRDIKPQNLKMTDQGQIILLDFGLAKGLPEQTLQFSAGQSVYGYTPDYAPLEQIKAEGTDARSDLYALAATLYHLLTTVTPPSALTRAVAIANNQPDLLRPAHEINPQVPPAISQVLIQGMALLREQRPASAVAMRQLWKDASTAKSPTNLAPTIVTPRESTAPIIGQPSSPVNSRPTQPGDSYPQPPQPSWPNAQPSQPSWPPPPQPPPQPSWPGQQTQHPSWPNSQPPQPSWPQQTQPSWPQAQPQSQSWPNSQPQQTSWPNSQPQWGGPQPSYIEPPRKSRTGLWVVFGIIVVLIIGGVVVLAIMTTDNGTGSTSVTKNSTHDSPLETKTFPDNKNGTSANTTPSTNANSNSSQATPENVVDKVLANYVQALGGEAALKAITSRVAKGTFEVTSAGISGTAELYQKAPNKNLFAVSVPGLVSSRRGFDGSAGWQVETDGTVKRITGTELASMKRDSSLYHEMNLRNDFSTMTLSGKEKVNGHDALVIDAVAADGSKEKMFFDMQSGLLLRNDTASSTGGTMHTYFDDYRAVDGVKLPFTIRQEDGKTVAVIRFNEVHHNGPINDSIFRMPSQ